MDRGSWGIQPKGRDKHDSNGNLREERGRITENEATVAEVATIQDDEREIMTGTLIPVETIEQSIYMLRGYRVMVDSDLAKLYEVENRVLIQAVKRNIDRFPEDFMFQLTDEEWEILRSQIVISKSDSQNLRSQIVTSKLPSGGRRYNPYVFTEQGVAMLSSILNSDKAVRVNIQIMRVFVRMRQVLALNEELRKRFDDLEKRVDGHDQQFKVIIDTIRQLMALPETPKRQVGFQVSPKGGKKE